MVDQKCSKCKRERRSSRFSKNKSRPDGFNCWCKDCEAAAYTKEYRAYGKSYKKEYYQRNKDKILQQRKSYRELNKDKVSQQSKKSYIKHRKKRIQEACAYSSKKLKEDVQVRLRSNLRSRLRQALHGNYKAGSTVSDLGCSVRNFKLWLEKQFYVRCKTNEKMSWENYGRRGWHIDHIKPLKGFNLSDREQFLEACHYTNLRPLWSEENLARNKKR